MISNNTYSKYHPVVKKIVDLLQSRGCWFETFEHEPVRTSEEAAQLRDGYSLHQGAKAMIIRVKKSSSEKFFAMLVLPGDAKFNNEKVRAIFQAKDIRLATPPEIGQVAEGVQIGGVPPFGNLFGLRVVVDPSVLANQKIIFNAGDRSFSVAMKSADYQQLVSPEIETFIED